MGYFVKSCCKHYSCGTSHGLVNQPLPPLWKCLYPALDLPWIIAPPFKIKGLSMWSFSKCKVHFPRGVPNLYRSLRFNNNLLKSLNGWIRHSNPFALNTLDSNRTMSNETLFKSVGICAWWISSRIYKTSLQFRVFEGGEGVHPHRSARVSVIYFKRVK